MTIPPASRRPDLADLVGTFGRIGLLSFGGPAGQIALMHRVLVEDRRWIDDTRFLHALNYCMLLPGPEALQLATYVGWSLRGRIGALIAGGLFVLPGAIVIIGLSALYLSAGHIPLVQGALYGLKAAVLALVVEAMLRLSRRALTSSFARVVAVLALIAIFAFHLPFPIILIAAAAAGLLWRSLAGPDGVVAEPEPYGRDEPARPTAARLLRSLAGWVLLWLAPLGVLLAALGPTHVLVAEAAFFARMAVVTFGGAYAVLAFVAQQAVDVHRWLKPDEMLTGLGLAETTPGPLILVLVFVGFLGAARQSELDPLLGGLAGALVTLWFTFVPSFMFIVVGAPFIETLRSVRWLSAALGAITAAVVGIMANLALWFGLHILFRELGTTGGGWIEFPVPVLSSFDWVAAAITLGAGLALIVGRMNLMVVLGSAVAAGVVANSLGWA